MNSQKLRMMYHPAKKEVLFERFGADGKKITIRNDSRLYGYMSEKKGQFVLQDYGNDFFLDIAKSFDGEPSVQMEVVTTRSDYEDFEAMVEYYNQEQDHTVKINATLLAELPDMCSTFDIVKAHGEDAVKILHLYKDSFWDIETTSEDVKKYIEKFCRETDEVSRLIRDKIDHMQDSNVNLCFTGVYSSGKSALINAILGYKILPEAINSKTARMFTIKSPKKNEPVRILFYIRGTQTNLQWDEEKNVFTFIAGPAEDDVRKNIQETINKHCDALQHEQILYILETLNQADAVGANIHVRFPVSLDNELIQFTIYDTPGSDSNYGEHGGVLKKALEEQSHSILVFVAAPNKLEGSGNRTLLKYLKEAENKDGKTSIDISRSFFVMNHTDSFIKDIAQRSNDLYKSEITLDEGGEEISEETGGQDAQFCISLANKKLFFTSALYGYVAKSVGNNVATAYEKELMTCDYQKLISTSLGRYYRFNRIATSELATKSLYGNCEAELAAALEQDDHVKAMRVASGVFALEKEAQTYGEKYAAAVRAFAIIDGVEKALARMNRESASLAEQNNKGLQEIESEIHALEETLEKSFDESYEKYCIKDGRLSETLIKQLQLDSDSISEKIHEPAENLIDKILKKWIFGILGSVPAKESHKREIENAINTVLGDYKDEFLKASEKTLEELRDNFLRDIKEAFQKNGEISAAAKDYICEIDLPSIKVIREYPEFNSLYDSNINEGWIKLPLIPKKFIDKDSFMQDLKIQLNSMAEEISKDYVKSYSLEMDKILNMVKTEFSDNKERYSVQMQAWLEDKKAMERLGEKINGAKDDLAACQMAMNKKIWSMKDD